jgi:iron complex outermembrane receptor protein
MDILGFFAQDEISLINDRLKCIAGVRTDLVSFHDGHQSIIEPTTATGFLNGFSENFKNNGWVALSPKLALQYTINSRARVYISAGTGFIPPDLKDLSQTGKIRKGFRIANPDLKPERLTNYELGYSLVLLDKVRIKSSVYYSDGHDFQYMVGTGDSIDTGGGTLKPILRPENIARIGILGAECSVGYSVTRYLWFNVSYSYNHSRITEFGISDANPDKDLTGKYMVEVSPHLFYAGMNYRYKSFSAHVNCNYTGAQWFDDENTIQIDDFFVANLRITETIMKHFKIYLDVQNIFNTGFIDRKGQLSPGRYITGGLQYHF